MLQNKSFLWDCRIEQLCSPYAEDIIAHDMRCSPFRMNHTWITVSLNININAAGQARKIRSLGSYADEFHIAAKSHLHYYPASDRKAKASGEVALIKFYGRCLGWSVKVSAEFYKYLTKFQHGYNIVAAPEHFFP